MDKLKQFIESAQGKTSQEKHSIALTVASAVSGALFMIWLGLVFYNLNTATPSSEQSQRTTSEVTEGQNLPDTTSVTPERNIQEPTYIDLDSVPAVYRPDSVGQPVQTAPENAQGTTPPQDTTVQGSDASTSVIE